MRGEGIGGFEGTTVQVVEDQGHACLKAGAGYHLLPFG